MKIWTKVQCHVFLMADGVEVEYCRLTKLRHDGGPRSGESKHSTTTGCKQADSKTAHVHCAYTRAAQARACATIN